MCIFIQYFSRFFFYIYFYCRIVSKICGVRCESMNQCKTANHILHSISTIPQQNLTSKCIYNVIKGIKLAGIILGWGHWCFPPFNTWKNGPLLFLMVDFYIHVMLKHTTCKNTEFVEILQKCCIAVCRPELSLSKAIVYHYVIASYMMWIFQGKVPRNEYGNVELFKPWMLPAGSAHMQCKLHIECKILIKHNQYCI